jgi:hypothetical protein
VFVNLTRLHSGLIIASKAGAYPSEAPSWYSIGLHGLTGLHANICQGVWKRQTLNPTTQKDQITLKSFIPQGCSFKVVFFLSPFNSSQSF